MSDPKDIRFSEKKVDENWKEGSLRDKGTAQEPSKKPAGTAEPPKTQSRTTKTSKAFVNLLSSLGYQALMHLGDIASPESGVVNVNLPAAKEIIDLLIIIKEKTAGNLSPEENELLQSVIPELQMKFSEKA